MEFIYEVETANDTLTGDGSLDNAVMTLARCFAAGTDAWAVVYADGNYSLSESERVENMALDLYWS